MCASRLKRKQIVNKKRLINIFAGNSLKAEKIHFIKEMYAKVTRFEINHDEDMCVFVHKRLTWFYIHNIMSTQCNIATNMKKM